METTIAVMQFAAHYGIGLVGATLFAWAWFYPYSIDKFPGSVWCVVAVMALLGPVAFLFGGVSGLARMFAGNERL